MTVVELLAGDTIAVVLRFILVLLRLALFAVALGLTVISFQAYSQKGGKRLESAFLGFAFISMGVAVSALNSQTTLGMANPRGSGFFYLLHIAETIPFVVGFTLLVVSLYR